MASIALALTGTVVLGGAAPAAAAEVCTVANPMGAATPTGSTDGYTIFVTENAILANSELEGTLAVGGTATFGDSRGNQSGQYPIFHGGAGGNANYNVPTIDGGPNRVLIQKFASDSKVVQVQSPRGGVTGANAEAGAKIGDHSTPAGYVFRQMFGGNGTTYYPLGGTNQSPQIESVSQLWIAAPEAEASWGISEANVLSYFPADSGTALLAGFDDWQPVAAPTGDDQTITLDADGPSKLPLSAFAGISKFKLANYDEDSFLVISVSPSDVVDGRVTLPSFSFAGKEAAGEAISYILFDFSAIPGEVEVVTPNEPVRGSIYAPNAHIVFPAESAGGKEFEGRLIAKNFTALQGGKEMHTNLFKGRIKSCTDEGTEVGGFSLSKALVGVSEDDFVEGTVFSVTASWSVDGVPASQVFDLLPDGTVEAGPQDLPVGTVVSFSEATVPSVDGYTFDGVTFSPSSVTIAADENIAVTATNTYSEDEVVAEVGGFSLSKALVGVSADAFVEGTVFSVTASWSVDAVPASQVFDLLPDGTVEAGPQDLPVGTVVSFSELSAPVVDGLTWQGVAFAPSSVTITKDANAEVTATNTYSEDEVVAEVGGFSLKKALVGVSADDFVEGTVFSVTASWTVDDVVVSESFNLPASGTVVPGPQNLPVGTVVSFSEAAAPSVDGYTFDGVVFSPSSVTITKDANAEVTATNTYTEDEVVVTQGGFSLSKALVGVSADAFVEGTVFSVTASWTVDDVPATQVFDLLPDGTVEAGPQDLPVGTVVSFSEPSAPSVDGYTWDGVTFSPSSVTIAADENIAVTATNTYVADEVVAAEGGFSLSKVLDGDATADDFGEGTVFVVTASWSIDGEDFSQEFELPLDGTVVAGPQDLPEGTVVTFSEATAPAVEGFTWEGVEFSPETVTIADGVDAEVTATNTYTSDEEELAFTGSETAPFLAAAVLAIGLGALMLVVANRRRRDRTIEG